MNKYFSISYSQWYMLFIISTTVAHLINFTFISLCVLYREEEEIYWVCSRFDSQDTIRSICHVLLPIQGVLWMSYTNQKSIYSNTLNTVHSKIVSGCKNLNRIFNKIFTGIVKWIELVAIGISTLLCRLYHPAVYKRVISSLK